MSFEIREKKKKSDKGLQVDVWPAKSKADKLESPDVQKRFDKVKQWRQQAKTAQAENRREMAIDQDYVDHLQWSEEDAAELEARGQLPLVYNLIALNCRWITGTEKRTRIDYRVLPRTKDDTKPAQSKTELLKYISDVNKEGFHRSRAFADCVHVGVGWMEDGIRNDTDDEPLFARYESWRNIWYDPLSKEPDLSDCRFLFREKWVDLDVAQVMFPKYKDQLKVASESITSPNQTNTEAYYDNPLLYEDQAEMQSGHGIVGDEVDMGTRPRVKLVECWYRTPEPVKVIRGEGTFNGAIFDKSDPVHTWAVGRQLATTFDAVKEVMRCMIFSGSTVLQDAKSPYWHNRFPFTPIWCFRRGRDNAPYGVVRGNRGAQDDLNKRRSKALFLLSTNQVIAEKGAVDDVQEAMSEVARPDGWIETNIGKKFEIRNQADLAQQHVVMMDADARFIQEGVGVTDENLGRQTNAQSGKAIEARQNQGYTATSDIFDNLRLAVQLTGERRLALIEQFYDDKKILRLTGERKGTVDWVEINEGENLITAMQADFVVDEQDYRGTVRQAMFETLLEMVPKIPHPEAAMKLLTLAFEMSDMPMRDEFVNVLREITGMEAPGGEDDPEKQAAKQQAMQAQQAEMQQQKQIQDTGLALQMKKLEEDIRLISAKADEAESRGEKAKVEALLSKLEALIKSMGIAGGVATTPQLAAAADQILADVKAENQPVNNIAPPLPPGVGS